MKQKFQVTGMTCSACSATVERNVKKLEGVKEVTVNLLSNSMVVSYDEDKVNNQTIIDTVVKAGYQAALEQKNNQKKEWYIFVLYPEREYFCTRFPREESLDENDLVTKRRTAWLKNKKNFRKVLEYK